MNTELMFSTGNEHWSTPLDLFDELNAEFKFTVDVCADTSNYKVKKHYNKKTNGLEQSWVNESVWCNPPYGKTISEWVSKAKRTILFSSNPADVVVMLLPARTDTKWFHDNIYENPHCEVRFIKGRLKFSGHKHSAPFPSMIVIFRKNDTAA